MNKSLIKSELDAIAVLTSMAKTDSEPILQDLQKTYSKSPSQDTSMETIPEQLWNQSSADTYTQFTQYTQNKRERKREQSRKYREKIQKKAHNFDMNMIAIKNVAMMLFADHPNLSRYIEYLTSMKNGECGKLPIKVNLETLIGKLD